MPTDLEEALTAATAAPLVQKQIDNVLLEYTRRYSPITRAIPTVKWGSTTYWFNNRSALVPGGFVTDGGARPVGNSVFNQFSFTIRNLQAVGAVTGYAQQVTADLIGSLRAVEIEGAARGLLWDLETAICWGNSAATAAGPYPQFDGLDTLVSDGSGLSTTNTIDYSATNGGAFDLAALDAVIDMVEGNVAMPVESSEWMFVLSPTLASRVAQILTNQQRFADQVEVAAGLIVPTYRNIPLVKSSFLNPRTLVCPTPTQATATTGGSIAASTTYRYKVSAVMSRFGETVASAEVTQASGGGTSTNVVTLTLTNPTASEGSVPQLWKVYRTAAGGATGTETLLGVVDASYFDASGNVWTTSVITDTGSALTISDGTHAQVSSAVATGYYGTNAALKPLATGGQNLYLMSRDPNFVVRPYVRDLTPVELYPTTGSPDALPFAFVSDTTLAVRAPKYMGRVTNVTAVLAS